MLYYIFIGLFINLICFIIFTIICSIVIINSNIDKLKNEMQEEKYFYGTVFYYIIPLYGLFYLIILIKNCFSGLSFIKTIQKTDIQTNIFKLKRKRKWVL